MTKKKMLMSAAAVASLSALAHFAAPPLVAQIRAALIRNIDEPGRSPYQSPALNGAFTPSECYIDFAPVPPNKRLVVQHLSAYVAIGAGNTIVLGKFLVPNMANGPRVFFNAGSVAPNQWAASLPMTIYVEPGGVPRLQFSVTSNVSCTPSGNLSGYLVDLTQ